MRTKVLMIGPIPPPFGGVQSIVQAILDSDLRDRVSLSVLDTSQKWRLRYNPDMPGILSPLYLLLHVVKLNYHLFKGRPGIVHLQSVSSVGFLRDSVFIMIGKVWRKKVVCHFHGTLREESPIWKYGILRCYFRFVMQYVDTLILLSERFVPAFDRLIPGTGKAVVPNFVSRLNCSKHRSDPKTSILFVGRLSRKKGVYDLLKAAVYLRDEANICFKLAGVGETKADEDRVISEVNKWDMQNRVSLLGYVQGPEKARLFAESDIFVLPSYTEIFPMVILEAMAASMPVVATPVGAVPDIIEDGVNGYLVPEGDYRLLAEKILYLVQHPERRAEMGTINRQKCERGYSVGANIDRIEQIYQRLAEGNGQEGVPPRTANV